MKTLKIFLVLVSLGYSFILQAQQGGEMISPAAGSQIFKIKQASDNIIQASVPKIKMPTMVQLDLAAQMRKIKEQCPYLVAQKPTLELEGERNSNNLVQLEWKTTNGWNNREFMLERSLDDTFHFETVSFVWAKQVAGVKDVYQKPDDNSHRKISFYRVRLETRDGHFLYSNIAAVNGYVIQDARLYPNPASGLVNLSITAETGGDATITVFNAAGKMVIRQAGLVTTGMNNREMNLSQLAAGLYTVKIIMPDKTEKTLQVIRQ